MNPSTVARRDFGKIVPAEPDRNAARDQADGLRRISGFRRRAARVLAVTSGKGGVGKTNLSVNLGLALAATGSRVVIVDLDLGLANADILFDIATRYNLADVISGRRSLDEVLVQAAPGLRIVPGASGVERLANLGEAERQALVAGLDSLCADADFVICDTGAGISRNTTSFLAAADEVLIVTTPEPTAVVDAYAVIKLIALSGDHGDLGLVINMAENAEEARRFSHGIAITANKLLNAYVAELGFILRDPNVAQSVRKRRPVFLEHPHSPASRGIRDLASRIVAGAAPGAGGERVSFVRRLLGALGR
ncbi:MAG TPA: MinD/ParA family protein [Planctomycetota bacterium]|nr:MinD/ParA family protein [Planctomycetota bacterium]